MKFSKLLLLVLPIFFASCGKHWIVNYSENPANSGTLHLLPSKQLVQSSLTVDGKLLAERQWIKKITVRNIPEGEHSFHFTCENSRYKDKVDTERNFRIAAGEDRTELIEVPPFSTGYWINSGLLSAGSWAALVLLFLLNDDEE